MQPWGCPTTSTMTSTPSLNGGGGLRPVGSVASLGSQGTMRSRISGRSQSPPTPKSRGHGFDGGHPRCFSSRHVPSVAEEIFQADHMNPSVKMRFSGLMKHLKNNTAGQDRQKQVLFKEQGELLVPEEYDEALHSEFERRCAFGERLNTELMSSAKWVKLLRDIGVIPLSGSTATTCKVAQSSEGGSPSSSPLDGSQAPDATMTRAEADIIFHKVVHNCDHGAQRLTYELFCKALCLAAHALWSDLEDEVAFTHILNSVMSIAQLEPEVNKDAQDCMLNANVLLVLDHFKPRLHDLFTAFCHKNLSNPAAASCGTGTVRIRERTIWKHTQDTIMASSMMGMDQSRFADGSFSGPSGSDFTPQGETPGSDPGSPSFGAAGSSPSKAGSGAMRGDSIGCTTPRFPLKAWAEDGPPINFAESLASLGGRSPRSSMGGSPMKAPKKDPYIYANGAPVIRNRLQHMSGDQFLGFCKDFKIMPDLLSRLEVVKVFKRAQTTGSVSSNGASMHGYLSRETFVDACGQLAVEAYSKEPFCDEYQETHEKIFGFFLSTLPDKKKGRHLKDQFLYGRT